MRPRCLNSSFAPALQFLIGVAGSSIGAAEDRLVQHILKRAPIGDPLGARHEFDSYCISQMPGSALGLEKGEIIEATVRQALSIVAAIHEKGKGEEKAAGAPRNSFNVLEVGSHMGDGTLRIITGFLNSGSKKPCSFRIRCNVTMQRQQLL